MVGGAIMQLLDQNRAGMKISTCHQPNVITVAERFALSLRNCGDYL